jgi:hypothetical protein
MGIHEYILTVTGRKIEELQEDRYVVRKEPAPYNERVHGSEKAAP